MRPLDDAYPRLSGLPRLHDVLLLLRRGTEVQTAKVPAVHLDRVVVRKLHRQDVARVSLDCRCCVARCFIARAAWRANSQLSISNHGVACSRIMSSMQVIGPPAGRPRPRGVRRSTPWRRLRPAWDTQAQLLDRRVDRQGATRGDEDSQQLRRVAARRRDRLAIGRDGELGGQHPHTEPAR